MPDHLSAQEDAFEAEMHLRQTMCGLPSFGFCSLSWNEDLFVDGVLALSEACILLKGGMLLSIPHNAACEPLNIGLFGNVRVSVFLHWMGESEAASSQVSDWRAGSVNVPKIQHRLRLSTQQAEPDARASIQLGIFEKQPDSSWGLTFDHIPPLVLVGTSPFLKHEISVLETALEGFQVRLSHDSVAALSVELMYGSRECLKSLLKLKRSLKHMARGIYSHPYHLFESLVTFYVEVCLYRDSTPVAARTLYDHENIASCYRAVLGPLLEQMTVASQKSPYLEFELRDGLYSVDMPKDIRDVQRVYMLVQKTAVNAQVDLSPLKLAAPARLAVVHQRALPGVGMRRVDQPSLGQSFGPEILFFELTVNDEWNAAVAEGALTFYSHPSFADCSFYLLWK
jgi:type VI secretion system protein ImpJ